MGEFIEISGPWIVARHKNGKILHVLAEKIFFVGERLEQTNG